VKVGRVSWPQVALGEICEFKYGKSLPTERRAGGAVNVYGSNGIVGRHDESITDGPAIVIGRKGSFGEVNVSPGACWPIDTTYYVDRTSTKVDLRWLAYQLAALGLNELNRAAAVPGLNREDAYRKRLLLPSFVEQQRIAAILDQAERVRTVRRRAFTRLSGLAASCFWEEFGDPTTNPKRWPTQSLSTLIADGPKNGLYKPSSDYGDGTPILRIDGFYDGEVTDLASLKRVRATAAEKESYGLRQNDLVINRVNSIDYLGKSALIPKLAEPTVFESNIMCIRLDARQVDPRFLVEFLQTAFVKRQIRTAAKDAINQASINQQDVKGFQVRVPPLATQRRFANQTVGIERLRVAYRASLAKLDALFASLQHRAFRGEL
jgi:type I restriction enzyme S subunit